MLGLRGAVLANEQVQLSLRVVGNGTVEQHLQPLTSCQSITQKKREHYFIQL
jgi:hypothetical protein